MDKRVGFVCFGEINTPIERLQMKHDEALGVLTAMGYDLLDGGLVIDDEKYATADAAADIILEGVCRKEGIIVVGEDANGMYARSTQDPEGFEAFQQREFKKGYDLFVGGGR